MLAGDERHPPRAVAAAVTRFALQAAPASLYARQPGRLDVPGRRLAALPVRAKVLGYPISVVTDVSGGLNIAVYLLRRQGDMQPWPAGRRGRGQLGVVDHLVDVDKLKGLSEVLDERTR